MVWVEFSLFTRMVSGINSDAEELMLNVLIFSWKLRLPLAVVSELGTSLTLVDATCM